MNKVVAVLLSFLMVGGFILMGYRWGHFLPAGESPARDLVIGLMVILSCIFVQRGFLRMGRESVETGIYKRGVLDLRGTEAVAAGRRLIVLGRCFIYFGVAFAWIFFLVLVVR